MAEKFILISEDFSQKILNEIAELKLLVRSNNNSVRADDELMDTAALMQYLKLDRRTIYTYRLKGMPCVQKDNGRIFFWKSAIDQYFGKSAR